MSSKVSGWSVAFVACAVVVATGLSGHAATAEPAPTQQQLADLIAEGLKDPAAKPIVGTGSACTSGSGAGSGNGSGDCLGGSGSSSGSSGGYASDTVGFGPHQTSGLAAFGYGLLNPEAAPAGANDWNCQPTERNPEPVVLLHGTWSNAYLNFAYMAQPLHDAGHCVFTLNYGQAGPLEGGGGGSVLPSVNATGYIEESAAQIAAFVDRVLAATGASKVNMVGHSQGGTVGRQYLKFNGGADKVQQMITLGATNHGTTLLGIAALGRAINNMGIDILGFQEIFIGHAGIQQTVGSDFINRLNAGGDTMPGVDYTVVGSRWDQVSTPYDQTFLKAGPGATVRNITLQDGCEQDLSDHITMAYSPRVLSIVLNALDPEQTPALACTFQPWLLSGV
ncbi:esterase/lipase family protein [Nocardia sp. NPDC058658]|uniref:esterase/lipase family protein n=1 Tax=Nocardia sp. NPDC058658 TaxID=3346580 RepID=UPI00365696F5